MLCNIFTLTHLRIQKPNFLLLTNYYIHPLVPHNPRHLHLKMWLQCPKKVGFHMAYSANLLRILTKVLIGERLN